MRGPLTKEPYKPVDTNSTLAGPNILTGAWNFNNKILIGFVSKSGTAVVPPWVVPYYITSLESELSKPSTTTALIDIVSGSITKVVMANTTAVPCGPGVRLDKYVYGYGYGFSSTFVDSNGARHGLRPLIKWSGSTAEPTIYTTGPKSGHYAKGHLSRLFVLGGQMKNEWTLKGYFIGLQWELGKKQINFVDKQQWEELKVGDEIKATGIPVGTTITSKIIAGSERHIGISNATTEAKEKVTATIVSERYEPNTLFYSVQNGPVTDSYDGWKDEVSGLLNKILVGNDDQNDFGVALAIVNQTLLIFKRRSIWALYGYSPSTFQVKNLTSERGCIDPYSVYEDDGGVYFMSQHGIEYFDGYQFRLVDEPIANITRPYARYHSGDRGTHDPTVDYGRVTITYAGNDYIFVTISGQDPSAGTGGSNRWAGYMHTGTGNWSEFSTSCWAFSGAPHFVGNTGSIPWAWDGRQINPMPFLTDPWSADTIGHPQVDVEIGGSKFGIPAKYWTDRIALSSPGYVSQYNRFLFDYRFPNGASDASAVDGWFVTLFGHKANETPIPETQVPGQAQLASTEYLNGRRWEKDTFNEAIDGRLQVEWKSTKTTDVKLAEVYDATVELQVARKRRST